MSDRLFAGHVVVDAMIADANVTLSARVGAAMRARVLENRRPGEDQSQAVRRLLETGLEAEATIAELRARVRELEARALRPAARAGDPSTAKNAAALAQPRAGTARARALELVVAAGADGLTADEVYRALRHRWLSRQDAPEPAVNGVAKRVSELLHAGAITEARRSDQPTRGLETVSRADDVLTRRTRHGREATVYVATELGRQWARENANP